MSCVVKILAISDQVMEQLYSPRVKETFAHVNLVVGCGDLPFYHLEYVVGARQICEIDFRRPRTPRPGAPRSPRIGHSACSSAGP